MNKYYIDEVTETVRMTLSPEDIVTAYKRIFFDSFRHAKEYLSFAYKQKIDVDYKLRMGVPGLDVYARAKEGIQSITDIFKEFIEEFESFQSLQSFKNSEEWKKRRIINNQYAHYMYMYNSFTTDFKDYSFKEMVKLLNLEHRLKAGNRYRKLMPKEKEDLKADMDKRVDKYLSETLEKQKAVEPVISSFMKQYGDLHRENKLDIVRQNDVKNMVILYLSHIEKLERQINLIERRVLSKCEKTYLDYEEVFVKDLDPSMVLYNELDGYNICKLTNEDVIDVLYVGESYNRLVIITGERNFARNNDVILIKKNMNGTPIERRGNATFYDEDEDNLVNEKFSEFIVPIWENFYGERFIEKE